MEVRSFVNCPLCGKEMRMTSGGFYYRHNLGIVGLTCMDCGVSIHEYAFLHGMKDAEAHSYGKLVDILTKRVKEVTR